MKSDVMEAIRILTKLAEYLEEMQSYKGRNFVLQMIARLVDKL